MFERSTLLRIAVASLGALCVAASAGAYGPSLAPSKTEPPPAPRRPLIQAQPRSAEDYDRLIHELDARERQLKRELDEVTKSLDLVATRMRARGRAYYRLVRAGLLPVGGGFDALVDHASRVERLRASLRRDIQSQRQLDSRKIELELELQQIADERAPLAAHRDAMKRAEVALRESDERRAAFLRAFGSSGTDLPLTGLGTGASAIYGAASPVEVPSPSAFAAVKGRLSFPLEGRAEVLQPPRQVDAGSLWLRASRDSAVRAVFPGRVAFVGATDRGETVVLDHGHGYFSVYSNLQRVEAKVDDSVAERGRIGWVLRQGRTAPQLWLELRHESEVLDASDWLGL